MDKAKVAALCRKALGAQVEIMRTAGFTYEEIEAELKLRPGSGMNSWRLAGNKHKKKAS